MRRTLFRFSWLLFILIPIAARLSCSSETQQSQSNVAPSRVQQAETQQQRDATVYSIQIFPSPLKALVGETKYLVAIAFDVNGVPVTGVQFFWSGVDPNGQPAPIGQDGAFRPTIVGSYQIKASGAAHQGSTTATVTLDPAPGDGYYPNRWNPDNRPPAFTPHYAIGEPSYRRSPLAKGEAVVPQELAVAGLGNSNFQFRIPVVSVSGRGFPLSISFTYNSELWVLGTNNTIYYGLDNGYPAPGFSFPFPRLVRQDDNYPFSVRIMLVESDGSRHPYTDAFGGYFCTGFCFWTTDGSFIKYQADFNGHGGWTGGTAHYPDGTIIRFGGDGFPQRIEDAHGNFISIAYSGLGQIGSVTDTVGRNFMFYYDAARHLTHIKGPDLGIGTQRDLVRFTYRTGFALPRQCDTNFGCTLQVSVPAPNVDVLAAVYYPATSTGYMLAGYYSSYGMLTTIEEQRNMTFTPSCPQGCDDQMGTIGEGRMTFRRAYTYPINPASLWDAPTFDTQYLQWDKGLGDLSRDGTFITYARSGWGVDPLTVTVTNPDGTKVAQDFYNRPTWDNGLLKEERLYDTDGTTLLRRVETNWNQSAILQDSVPASPVRSNVITTDLRSGEKLRVDFGGAANSFFGQPLSIDYQQVDALGGLTSLRFIKFTYVNDWPTDAHPDQRGPYAARHLLNLTSKVEVFDTSALAHRLSETDYAFDTVSYAPDRCVTTTSYEDLDTVYGNNKQGNVTQITRYTQTDPSLDGGISENRTYDKNGNLVTTATCCDQVKSFYNDSNTHCAYPDAIRRGAADPNPPSVTIDAGYDLGAGLVVSTTDANNATTRFSYFSGSLRLQQVTLPAGGTHAFAYDDSNLAVTTTDTADAGQALQITKRFTGLGQLRRRETSAPGNAWDVMEMKYDNMGRRAQQSLPFRNQSDERWNSYSYDSLSQVTAVTDSDGGTTQYFYNESPRPPGAWDGGHAVRIQDTWGRSRWSATDILGRLRQVAEPDPQTGRVDGGSIVLTDYTFNGLDLVTDIDQATNLPQAQQQHRRLRYDSLGRLLRQKLPEKKATLDDSGTYVGNGSWSDVFTWGERSNLLSHTDARGVIAQYNYGTDPLNRLLSVHYDSTSNFGDTGNPVVPTGDITYQYRQDANTDGTQVSQVLFGPTGDFLGGSISYGYDNFGRLQTKTQSINGLTGFDQVVEYTPDSLNRLGQTKYPAQYGLPQDPRKIITKSFDAASRVSGLQVAGTAFASNVTYTAAGQPSSLNIGSSGSLTETYTYELVTGLLSTQAVQSGGTPLLQLNYDYSKPGFTGATGQLSKMTNGRDGQRNRAYTYDGLGRLIQATGGDFANPRWTELYGFDQFGNRTSVTANGTTEDGTPIPVDGLPALSYDSASNHVTTDSYDADGNVVCGQKDATTWLGYQYDAAGRLVLVSNNCHSLTPQPLESFGYGADRHRLLSKNASTSLFKYYVWNGNTVVAEYSQPNSSSFSWSKGYVYLGTRLLATLTPDGLGGELVEFDHPDRLGTRLMSHSASSDVQEQVTLPFGTVLGAESTGSTNRRFTSYDRSAITGLDYAVNRTYESPQGRFTQPDPNSQGFNLYSYGENDPVNRIDPTGLTDEPSSLTVTWPYNPHESLCGFQGRNCGRGSYVEALNIDRGGGGSGGGDSGVRSQHVVGTYIDENGKRTPAYDNWYWDSVPVVGGGGGPALDANPSNSNGGDGLTGGGGGGKPSVDRASAGGKSFGKALASCLAEHFGFTAATAGVAALGAPVSKAALGLPTGFAGASDVMSLSSAIEWKVFGTAGPRLPVPVMGTSRLFGAIGRSAPWVAGGMAVIDASMIGACIDKQMAGDGGGRSGGGGATGEW